MRELGDSDPYNRPYIGRLKMGPAWNIEDVLIEYKPLIFIFTTIAAPYFPCPYLSQILRGQHEATSEIQTPKGR